MKPGPTYDIETIWERVVGKTIATVNRGNEKDGWAAIIRFTDGSRLLLDADFGGALTFEAIG